MPPKFGTSGLRGLVTELTDDLCGRYAQAFLQAMGQPRQLMLGRDLRPSSARIADAVSRAATDMGVDVVDCATVPTPALALKAVALGAPAVMVTGSHIPADRNGLKFYSAKGEITKAQEVEIGRLADRPCGAGPRKGVVTSDSAAGQAYVQRYVDFFGATALEGLRVGVYQHSSVARGLLVDVVCALGAVAVPLGASDIFIPVDTEAVDSATRAKLREWAGLHGLDAILSADGDADRPLLTDEAGEVVPGDTLGVICARDLGADLVVTPVSSNTIVEATGAFARVVRTRIGSPFVIAALDAALEGPCRPVGYEANGGFLLGFTAVGAAGQLAPLMTRDGFLPMLATLSAARQAGQSVSTLVGALPPRRMASDRLEHVETEKSQALVQRLSTDPAARAQFFAGYGAEAALDLTDGLRVRFADGVILHLRPSGNAPELRCYAEAESGARAETCLRDCLARAQRALP